MTTPHRSGCPDARAESNQLPAGQDGVRAPGNFIDAEWFESLDMGMRQERPFTMDDRSNSVSNVYRASVAEDILRLVLREGTNLAAAGVVLGLMPSLPGQRALARRDGQSDHVCA